MYRLNGLGKHGIEFVEVKGRGVLGFHGFLLETEISPRAQT